MKEFKMEIINRMEKKKKKHKSGVPTAKLKRRREKSRKLMYRLEMCLWEFQAMNDD